MSRPLSSLLVLCALFLSASLRVEAAPTPTEPSIVVVKGTSVLVHVPDGFAAVHLQVLTAPPKGRAMPGQRAARPQWKTVAGKRTDGKAGYVRLMVPALTPLRYLRVYGLHAKEVPADLVSSEITAFGPDVLGENATFNSTSGVILNRGVTLAAGGMVNFAMASNSVVGSGATLTPTRTVTESDIWKIAGDRLYFFNSARGLQVFDLATPDDPAMLGTLRLQGAGEEMYLLDPSHVVLLTNQTQKGSWTWSDASGSPFGGGNFNINVGLIDVVPINGGIAIGGVLNGGVIALNRPELLVANAAQVQVNQVAAIALEPVRWGPFGIIFGPSSGFAGDQHSVVVAEVRNGVPSEIARVPFKGALRESRLVGKVLYLCTHTAGAPGTDSIAPTLNVISIDLSDPENPVQRGQVSFDGSEAAVYATDRYFFVAPASVTVATSVYSTYAVASTQVQVVDISDPTGQIALAGSVAVRGFVRDKFKMNLEGDVFTAVGQDSIAPQPGFNSYYSNPVSVVSTFSLADPQAPVALGTLEVAPGEALFATRYVGTRLYLVTTTPQYIDPLAIIDLSAPATPTIIGELHVPGYSTYIEPIGDRLVTTGMQNHTAKVEMYDVSNPAAPTQISSLALGAPESGVNSEALTDEKAFTVLPEEGLILLPVAAHAWNGEGATGVQIIDLLETGLVKRGVISSGMSTRRATVHRGRIVSISATKLTVVNAADRDQPLVTADVDISWSVEQVLVAGRHLIEIAGTSVAAEVIVAPAEQPDAALASLALPAGDVVAAEARGDVLYVVQRSSSGWSYNGPLVLSTIDLAHLPKLKLLGQTTSSAPAPGSYGSDVRPLWVNDRTLLLSMTKSQFGQVQPLKPTAAVNAGSVQPIGSFNARARELLAIDVTLPAKPKFVSDLTFGEDRSWTVGPAVTANDTVYVSYKVAPHIYYSTDGVELDGDPEQADRNKYYLKQIDYSDSTNPVVSDARVNIPGELRALSRQGSLLYTFGAERDPVSGDSLNKDFALHACSYDGTLVHLLDQVRLTGPSQPFAVSGETVFLFDPQPEQIWVPDPKPPTPPDDSTSGDAGAVDLRLTKFVPQVSPGSNQPNPKKSTLSTLEVSDDGKFVQRDSLKLEREVVFKQFGGLTVLHGSGPSVRFVDSRDPQALHDLGTVTIDASGNSSLDRADADLNHGLWLPLGTYGVEFVPLDR